MFSVVMTLVGTLTFAQAPPVPQPVPQPRERSSQPARPAAPPPAPSAPQQPAPPAPSAPAGASSPTSAAGTEQAPTEATLGVPIFPNAQFIASYNAGRGQRYYIFGTSASFVDLVTYYRTTLKQRGELVFDVPATHQ